MVIDDVDLLAALPALATGGEDANPSDDALFTVEERTTPSQDGQTWTSSVASTKRPLTTAPRWPSRPTTNNGVCDLLIGQQEATVSGRPRLHHGPRAAHRPFPREPAVKATYDDDSTENFPQGKDWYKTWSSCYYSDGAYGGVHANGDGCNVRHRVKAKGSFPHPAWMVTAALTGAVVVAARKPDLAVKPVLHECSTKRRFINDHAVSNTPTSPRSTVMVPSAKPPFTYRPPAKVLPVKVNRQPDGSATARPPSKTNAASSVHGVKTARFQKR